MNQFQLRETKSSKKEKIPLTIEVSSYGIPSEICFLNILGCLHHFFDLIFELISPNSRYKETRNKSL